MSTEENASLADLVRDSFIARAPGPSEVTDDAAQVVYGHLFGQLTDADAPDELAAEACAGLLAGAKKHRAPIWHAARGALIGIVHAAIGHHLEVESLIRAATRRLMTEADGQGGDFTAAAQGAVEGALTAADELGLDPEDVGSLAATAAMETTKTLPEGAREKVLSVMNRKIMGVAIQLPRSLLEA